MISRIGVNAISFVSSIILARLLLPEDFGLVAIALSISAIITALTSLPIGEALIRLNHIEDNHFDSAFTLGILRSGVLACILLLAAVPVGYFYGDARLAPIMFALAAQALVAGFYSPRWMLIQKRLSFGPDAFQHIATRVVSAITAIFIAYYYRSYWAIIAPILVMQTVSVVITYVFAPYRPRLCIARIPEIWSFSIWMTFSTILKTVGARLDTLLIGGMLGQRAVGFYNYGEEKAALPTRELSSPLISLLFPGLAAVKNDPARLAAAYKRVQTLIFAVCAPLGVGFALVADMFVQILLGEKWLPIIPIMQVLAVTLAFENLVIAVAPLTMVLGRTRTLFARDALTFSCRIPLIVAGLWLLGIEGALISRVLATLCFLGVYLTLARDVTNMSIIEQLKGCFRTFFALAGMAACVIAFKMALPSAALTEPGFMLATVALGAIVYGVLHGGLWAATGRPQGPESEIFSIADKFWRPLRTALSVKSRSAHSER